MPSLSQPTSIFPFYLIPNIRFRRRSSTSTVSTVISESSDAASASSSPSADTGILAGHQSILRCSRCLTQLCSTDQVISKGFTGRHGRAYLVAPPAASSGLTPPSTPRHHETENLPNTHTHKPVPRQLVTGAHTVSDISCMICGSVIGWKYVAAEEDSQRYKVGKFILETKRVLRGVCWENDNDAQVAELGGVPVSETSHALSNASQIGNDEIEFDSEDDDECEDLFAGVWSPALARRRRRLRAWRDGRD